MATVNTTRLVMKDSVLKKLTKKLARKEQRRQSKSIKKTPLFSSSPQISFKEAREKFETKNLEITQNIAHIYLSIT
jgi:hypothetical protein